MKKTSRAGVSDTRAGLQPAGLFSNAGIFKKGFQDFHPLDESPYLLFDAESSMLGNLENPSLDLDASKAETLDVITATRAGIATFTATDGQIVTADPDTVRVDWSLGYPAMLIETSATNFVPYSEDFEAGNWSLVALGTGSNPVITPDYAVSPDGTQNASRIQFDKGSGTSSSDLSILRYNVSVTSGLSYSKSIYLKSNTSEAYDLILHESADASGTNVKKITVTPEWQRFDVYGVVSSTTAGISFGLRNINVTGVSDTADVLAYGAQLEAGSVATSYIPTSGSAGVRSSDNLVIDGTAFSDFYNQSEGTVYVEATGRGYDNFNTVYSINDGTPNERFYLRTPTNNAFVIRAGGVEQCNLSQTNSSVGELARIAGSYKLNDVKYSKDGAGVSTDTSATMPTGLTRINVGSSVYDANFLNGHIKRLIYWPTHSDSL